MKNTFIQHSSTQIGAHQEISHGFQTNPYVTVFLPGFYDVENGVNLKDHLIAPERIPITPTRRLVVILPDGALDEKELANRIWKLASTSGLNVLFLALSPSQGDVAYMRRRLADMAAMMKYGHVGASAKIFIAGDWTQVIAEILHAGDLLVCMAKHQVSHRVLGHRLLGELLSASFNVPVYMLEGFSIGQSRRRQKLFREVLTWLLFFTIIVAFAGIQFRIDQEYLRPLSTILLCISVIFEMALVLLINEWMD